MVVGLPQKKKKKKEKRALVLKKQDQSICSIVLLVLAIGTGIQGARGWGVWEIEVMHDSWWCV
jgi:hypothetical protein